MNSEKYSKSDGWSPALNTLAIRRSLNKGRYVCRKILGGS
ncbi:hypothetical protein FHS68_002161 [Dyadobacter arcticus]|uniref:Uncharacterized protein n=1 Tax=Dyadobacter arcticus TaxID=1078754 RepID=A0ABX0UJ77_9BACT|nr:hypothetical protein [Dyadobacter arcticus]